MQDEYTPLPGSFTAGAPCVAIVGSDPPRERGTDSFTRHIVSSHDGIDHARLSTAVALSDEGQM